MAISLEGYEAIMVKGKPRYRKDGRGLPPSKVPKEIREALEQELAARATQKVSQPVVEGASEETTANGTELEATQMDIEDALTAMDFEEPAENGTADTPTDFEMELIQQLEDVKQQLAENAESDTLKSATVFELADELYARFGVYTVFVGKPPRDEDVHPFTGDIMTRYDVGLAYQKHNQAMAQGKLQRDFKAQHDEMERTREASALHQAEMAGRANMTADDHVKSNSFEHRTSVEGQKQTSAVTVNRANDQISEDTTPEPNLHGQTIRPNW